MPSGWSSALPNILKAFLAPAMQLPARLRATILFEILLAGVGAYSVSRGMHDAFYWTMILMTFSFMFVIIPRSEGRDTTLEAGQNKAVDLIKPNA
jgi:hypothetical protein